MVQVPDGGVWTGALATAGVSEALARARTVRRVHPVAEVGSTQEVALALAREGALSGTLVVTDHQTAGRGQRGRRWDDHPDGGTLALTLLLDADVPVSVALVPHALGLALVDAFGRTVGAATPIGLKWPNDVVHRDGDGALRKLCGVLVERERVPGPEGGRDVLLCGMGIDVDLRGIEDRSDRICLATLAGAAPRRDTLLAAVITALDEVIDLLADPAQLLQRYRGVSDTIGRQVRVEPVAGPSLAGLATAVDETGRLVVTNAAGEHAILSGTVRDAERPHVTMSEEPT